jgi:PAS domain S-box-containing protein
MHFPGRRLFTSILRDITKRKQMEHALREREEEYRAMFELASVGKAQVAPWTGRFLRVNRKFCEITGYTAEELLEKSFADITHPEHCAADMEGMQHLARGEIAEYSTEKRYLRKDGRIVWVHLNAAMIRDSQGSPVATVGVFQDITERKEAEQRGQDLAEVSRALSESLDFDRTLSRIANLMVPRHADWCLIDVLNEETRCQRVAIAVSNPEKQHIAEELLRHYSSELSRPHPILNVVRTGHTDFDLDVQPDWVEARAQNHRHAVLLRQMEKTGSIIVPLQIRGRVIGTISLVASRWSGKRFTRADVDFAEEIGRRASIALENARLHSELRKELEERTRTEQALRESEERLRLALASADIGTWSLNVLSGENVWDARCKELFGLHPEAEVPFETFLAGLHPEDRARVEKTVQRAFDPEGLGTYDIEYRTIGLQDGGRERWVRAMGRAFFDEVDGVRRAVRFTGTAVDITERKRSEETLWRLNETLEAQVKERTAQLLVKQDQLRALAADLSLAEQRERRRLATELHDYLAQLLVLSRLKLGQARQGLSEARSVERLKEADEFVDQSLTYTRTLMAELSPPGLKEFGLPVALKWLAEQMQRHELHVEVQLEPESLSLPEPQAVLLFQSVRELVMNVVKHAQTSCATISLGTTSDDAVLLTVSDAGCGFEPAVSGQGTQGPIHFGLFSIRERMEALGGRFELQSAPGRGTRATLVLPAASARSAPAAAQASSTPTRTASVSQRPRVGPVRVVLVDDHTLMRQGLRSLLEGEVQVQIIGEASDGEEAVALARTLKPEVIIMDINMPKMDGIEATRQIKQELPMTRVIGLSFHNSGTIEQEMRAAGAVAFIRKDAAADQLCQAIAAAACCPG